MNGTMLWFHEERGKGFLLSDGGDRLPVDRDSFVGRNAPVGRCAGLPVRFTLAERNGEPLAVDVALVEVTAPARRARRHGSSYR